jgi:hypothetical protein
LVLAFLVLVLLWGFGCCLCVLGVVLFGLVDATIVWGWMAAAVAASSFFMLLF